MFKKIIVALDRSSLAEQALESAVDIVKQNPGAQLVLLTIVENTVLGEGLTYGGLAYKQMQTQVRQMLQEDARKYMDGIVANLKQKEINPIVEIRTGTVAEEIVDFASKNQADLIVITTHGRSGLGKFFLGSVAGKVISISSIPVLVIPPKKK
jgi:nucleotide-binding universal stress UspA family protein